MKLDDRDITCERSYDPLTPAELMAEIELYTDIALNSPLRDSDPEEILGPARALLARVEAAWADRFEPSWMIFIPSPSLMWQGIGESFVDGIAAGLRKGAWLMRVTAEIRMALHGRRWFRALPEWARHRIVTRRVRAREQQEDTMGGKNL